MKRLTPIIILFIFVVITFIIIKLIDNSHISSPNDITATTPASYPTIDTTITQSPDNSGFQNTSNNFETHFKPDPTSNNSITFNHQSSVISFYTPTHQNFGYLQPGVPNISKNTITYSDIFPSLDLRYTVSSTRLLEEFIAKDSSVTSQINSVSQNVSLTNIDNYTQNDNSISFYYKGKLMFSIPKPVLYELKDQRNRSYGIKYDIIKKNQHELIVTKKITPEGQQWLADPHRSYPIAIDLVIDNGDTSSNWVSSNSNLLISTQETTIKEEGTGSVKLTPTTSWYDYAWTYRIKLTVLHAQVSGNQADFPIYVNLADLPAGFHTHVNQTDARDIRVTTSDGVIELPREVVKYDSATDTGEMHFKYTNTLSSTVDTDVYIYYGNSGASDYLASDTYGRNNVWNSNYKAVWHLSSSSGGTAIDSSVNSYDSSSFNGSPTWQSSSKIGYGIGLSSPSNQWINFADNNDFDANTNNFTACLWMNPNTTGPQYAEPLGHRIGTGANNGWEFRWTATNTMQFLIDWGATTSTTVSGILSAGTWYYLCSSVDRAGSMVLYINGSSVNSTNISANVGVGISNTDYLRIGDYSGSNSYDFDGIIDEVTFSDTNRLAGWITTSYNNQNAPASFYSVSTEESILGQNVTRTVSPVDLSSYTSLTYWVRSNRTGQFMKFQFGESTSSEQTNNITINSANTWEQKTWDISGISSDARNAVTLYAFQVTDSSANFSFYFDNILTNSSDSPSTNNFNFEGLKFSGIKLN